MTREEKARLCEAEITLNGKPAQITGAANRFATITERESGLSAEWSWPAVKLVVDRGGAFLS